MAYRFQVASSQSLSALTAVISGPPFSVSCWFKLDSTSDSMSLVSVSNFNSAFEYFRLAYIPGTGLAAHTQSGTPSLAVATASPSASAWHHAGGVWASSSSKACYLDGGNKGTDTTNMSPSGVDRTAIGALLRSSNPAYSTGEIAEVAVWNAALSDEEIALLGKGFSPLCMPWRWPNLVLYQDLIRPLNRLGIGPTLTAAGSLTVVPHPRAIYPTNPAIGLCQFPPFIAPYRLAAALAHVNRVRQGLAAVAGPSMGDTYSIGEVSS
jgi:hypothetical protein